MKKLFTLLISIILIHSTKAQMVNYKIVGNDIENRHKLHIRPYLSFYIPPSTIGRNFHANLNVDAQYWFPKLLDVRAGINIGSFKGGTFGATYHLIDKIKSKNNKYVLSRTTRGKTETTTFLKAKANSHIIVGPCLDAMLGVLTEGGFYTKIDVGLDYQSFSRSYAEIGNRTIPGARNGWVSCKVQGVVVSMNHDDNIFDAVPFERRLGIGGQINLQASARPWRGVTFYAALPIGFVKVLGPAMEAPTITKKDKNIQPILYINIGASINLL
jgi:hypothetical protein